MNVIWILVPPAVRWAGWWSKNPAEPKLPGSVAPNSNPPFSQSSSPPPPHSWKSTINHVSSKPDTSPSPAHPHGDHYESPQSCVLWPNQATHEQREPIFYPNMDQNVSLSVNCFSLCGHKGNTWQQLRCIFEWRTRSQTGRKQKWSWRTIFYSLSVPSFVRRDVSNPPSVTQ